MKEWEIKPCPYCGSTDIDYGKCLTNKTRTGKEFFVKCENCGTEVNVSYNTFDETNLALEMWNNAKCACADEEKVSHGEWLERKDNVFECSHCGYQFDNEGYLHFFNYCPCCGAKMDKEESKMSDNLKYDDNKPRLDLVPPELIEAVGIVRTYGVSKYGDSESWKQVEPYRYRAALMRHICLYIKEPDGVDAESGLPHLWHIACNVAFLIALNAEKCPISDFKAKRVNLSD